MGSLGIEPSRRGRALHIAVIPRDICYDAIILIEIVLWRRVQTAGGAAQ